MKVYHLNMSKACIAIGIIKYMSDGPIKTLDQKYKIFVRAHLDYCDMLYHLLSPTTPFDNPINFMMQNCPGSFTCMEGLKHNKVV